MQFSSDDLQHKGSSSLDSGDKQRSSNSRLALVRALTKRLSYESDSNGSREEFLNDSTRQKTSTSVQEAAKSILRPRSIMSDDVKLQKSIEGKNEKNSGKGTSKPKVSFGEYVEKHSPVREPPTRWERADGYKSIGHGLYLSDPSNPVLHPPRLTSKKNDATTTPGPDKKKMGRYRKPLEMLLNLLDKYWSSPRSLHQNNNFLSQCVHILSMMETDLSTREAEVTALKQEVTSLKSQASAQDEKQKSEICNFSDQLEESRSAMVKLNQQLNLVMEENVTLQKRLVKIERQHFKFMMKSSPLCQIKEAQTEVMELRKEIEGLREKVLDVDKVAD